MKGRGTGSPEGLEIQTLNAELERVLGASLENLPADAELLVRPATDPETALSRCRQVMETVLRRSSGEWPPLEVWRHVLPTWFVESCVDDSSLRDCVIDRWSFRAWIYWLRPDVRPWRWWGAEAAGGELRVAVLPRSRPYLSGALAWLLQVSARP